MPTDEMVEKARNRIWFDTEFIEDGRTIDLLAIGLVREDGATYYAEPEETDRSRACEWVRANVLPHLTGPTKPRAVIAAEIVEFVGASPEFWAYYADYDWVALCQLYGRMVDLPKGWPMFCRDLKQVAGDRKLIPQTTTEHNALTDAIWTKEAHAALSAAHAEPVAWRYELAGAVTRNPDGSKTGVNWKTHINANPPCAPDWGVRNLTPLYTSPSEAAIRADERAAIRKEAFEEAARIAEATKNYDDNLQRSAGALPCGERIATAIRARGERC